MAYADPREALDGAINRLGRFVEDGELTADDANRIREIVEAYDEENTIRSSPDGESSRSPTTLTLWISHMSKVGREVPLDELHSDPNGDRDTNINAVIKRFLTGESDLVGDGGVKKKTVQKIQFTMRRFYRYHSDLNVDPDEINYYSDVNDDGNGIDPSDMLTKEEIQAVRKAADHPRDEAMFTLLLYTGMRNAALRSLRWKDINLEDGLYKYNPNCEALKGADKVGEWRTLLDAAQPLRDWKSYHPDPDNPDAYVFTKKPRWTPEDELDPEVQLSSNTVSYTMRKLKDATGIDKPMHPHMLRHNFVTIAKQDYDMPDSTVKFLIGHAEDSDVMQRVYSHLSDESHNEKAEIAAGIRDPEEGGGSRLTPESCRTCGAMLDDDDKACNRCGTVFTLDAHTAKQQIEKGMQEANRETHPDDEETIEELDAIQEALEDPETRAEVVELLAGKLTGE